MEHCSSCGSYISSLLLSGSSGSSGSLSACLKFLSWWLQSPSVSAALPAHPQRSEQACISATAGRSLENH